MLCVRIVSEPIRTQVSSYLQCTSEYQYCPDNCRNHCKTQLPSRCKEPCTLIITHSTGVITSCKPSWHHQRNVRNITIPFISARTDSPATIQTSANIRTTLRHQPPPDRRRQPSGYMPIFYQPGLHSTFPYPDCKRPGREHGRAVRVRTEEAPGKAWMSAEVRADTADCARCHGPCRKVCRASASRPRTPYLVEYRLQPKFYGTDACPTSFPHGMGHSVRLKIQHKSDHAASWKRVSITTL